MGSQEREPTQSGPMRLTPTHPDVSCEPRKRVFAGGGLPVRLTETAQDVSRESAETTQKGRRFLDTVEVTGSIPVSPTSLTAGQGPFKAPDPSGWQRACRSRPKRS